METYYRVKFLFFCRCDIRIRGSSLGCAKLENLTCQAECGDVDLILPEELEKYEVDLQIEYGDLSLPKDTPHDQYREEDGEVSYRISASEKNAGKKISVINEEGDVKGSLSLNLNRYNFRITSNVW